MRAPPRPAVHAYGGLIGPSLTELPNLHSLDSARPRKDRDVSARASVVRLLFTCLTASIGVLLGASIPFVASSMDGLTALLGMLVLALVASAAAETLGHRPRAARGAAVRVGTGATRNQPEQMARHDALTGLPNRHVLYARLRNIIEGRRQGDRGIAVLMLDRIDFKGINAGLGSAAGDLLLRHAGARLLATLRDTDTLARMGADEFAILQCNVERPGNTAAMCERLLSSFEEPFDLCGHLTKVGARIGIAMFPADGADTDALLEHARLARVRTKTERSGGFRFYADALDAERRERRALESDLAHALERAQFELHYQPQIDLASRRMVGVEALLRWTHPERGSISPDQFIPLAEDSGRIVPIGAWVLEQACAQAVRWQKAGAPTLRMSVNMSPVQVRQPDLAGLVSDILARTGLAAPYLELEITGRVLMQDSAADLETLRRIKNLGVRISIDVFGAGHASLSYLRSFPFDAIKLDGSLIGALERDPSAAAIVRATLSLGRSLGVVSVAEGGGERRPARPAGRRGLLSRPRLLFQPAGPPARGRCHDSRHHGAGRHQRQRSGTATSKLISIYFFSRAQRGRRSRPDRSGLWPSNLT
jgi:diguanylate cyclase (GGDEF)-like protein